MGSALRTRCRRNVADGLVVPADPAAQPLGFLAVRLAGEPPLARGARGLGRSSALRLDQRSVNEVHEPAVRFAAVLFLGTVIASNDQQRALLRNAATGEFAQPFFSGAVQHGSACKIETQLHGGCDLVDVLATGA